MTYQPPLWLDMLRYVALGQALMVILMVLFIIFRYSYLLQKVPKIDRALPAHVLFISISYVMMLIGSLLELHERIGLPWTWRSIVYPLAFLIGDVALIFMLVHISVQRTLVGAVLRRAQEALADDLHTKHKENLAAMGVLAEKVDHAVEVIESTNGKPSK